MGVVLNKTQLPMLLSFSKYVTCKYLQIYRLFATKKKELRVV